MVGTTDLEEPPIEDDTYYSEEETDEDVPIEKDDLQKRVKDLKRVTNIQYILQIILFLIETRYGAWAYRHGNSPDEKVSIGTGPVHTTVLEPP